MLILERFFLCLLFGSWFVYYGFRGRFVEYRYFFGVVVSLRVLVKGRVVFFLILILVSFGFFEYR